MSPLSKYLILAAILLLFSGCATPRPEPPVTPQSKPVTSGRPSPSKEEKTIERPEEIKPVTPPKQAKPAEPQKDMSPRALAAVSLTDQGKTLIERKRYDEAIRVLERAVNLHPQNGENYYYLAEAWALKKNFSQAAEFNQLAFLYLKEKPQWESRLKSQRTRINEQR